MKRSIRKYLEKFDNRDFESKKINIQCDAGWYDWFCKDTSLANKTITLTKKLKTIVSSKKINQDKMYVFFKNNCPMAGSLYDDFRICNIETGDVVYTITPSCGRTATKGRAEVWGKENEFEKPLVSGTWKDVKSFFLN